jgi:hypothetical protein
LNRWLGIGENTLTLCIVLNKMKEFNRIILLIIIANLSIIGFCQHDTIKKSETELIFDVDNTPEYPGGSEALTEFISSKAIYPKEYCDRNIQGKVFIQFIIDTSGLVTNPKVLRGIDPTLDSISISIVNSMPKWKAATQEGKPVNFKFLLPLKYSCEKKEKH